MPLSQYTFGDDSPSVPQPKGLSSYSFTGQPDKPEQPYEAYEKAGGTTTGYDYVLGLKASVHDVAGSAAAGFAASTSGDWRDYWLDQAKQQREARASTINEMTPSAKHAQDLGIFDSEFWQHPLRNIGLQLSEQAAPLAAQWAPAFVGGLVAGPAGASAGGALGVSGYSGGAWANQLGEAINSVDDKELQERNKDYAAFRRVHSEEDAKNLLWSKMVDETHGPLKAAGIGAVAGAFGPAAQMSGFGSIDAALARRALAGSVEGTITFGGQTAATDVLSQSTQHEYGVRKEEPSASEILKDTASAAIIGGGLGAFAGATHKPEAEEKEEPKEESTTSPTADKQVATKQTPSAPLRSAQAAPLMPEKETIITDAQKKAQAQERHENPVAGENVSIRSGRTGRTKERAGADLSATGEKEDKGPPPPAFPVDEDQKLALQAATGPPPTTDSWNLQRQPVESSDIQKPVARPPSEPAGGPPGVEGRGVAPPPPEASPTPAPAPALASPGGQAPVGPATAPQPVAPQSQVARPVIKLPVRPVGEQTATAAQGVILPTSGGEETPGPTAPDMRATVAAAARPPVPVAPRGRILRPIGEETAPVPIEERARIKRVARPAEERAPGHATKAQIAARTANNLAADSVFDNHSPSGRDVRALLPADNGGTGAMAILRARAQGMVDEANSRGVKVPKAFVKSPEGGLDHSSSLLIIDEARRFLQTTSKKGLEEKDRIRAVEKFLMRERDLQQGKYEDILQERVKEAEAAIATQGIGPQAGERTPVTNDQLSIVEGESPEDRIDRMREQAAEAGVSEEDKKLYLSPARKVEKAAGQTEEPSSRAAIEAGNYKKGKVTLEGHRIAIETAEGQTRSGVGADGKEWSVKMPTNYGYILGTKGPDGDHVDVYIGPEGETGNIFVMNQLDKETGKFDEPKVFMGYDSVDHAISDYQKSFDDVKESMQRIGGVVEMDRAHFDDWLKNGDMHQPVGENISGQDLSGRIMTAEGKTFSPLTTEKVDKAYEKIDLTYTGATMRPFMAVLANRLRNLIKEVPVYGVSDADMDRITGRKGDVNGFYQQQFNHIVIRNSLSPKEYTKTLIHESVHAATLHSMDADKGFMKAITRLQEEAYQALKNQLDFSGPQLDKMYGFTKGADGLRSPYEFIAEALSDEEFQTNLGAIDISPELAKELHLPQWKKASVWGTLVDYIRRKFNIPEKSYSALEAAMAAGEYSMWAKEPEEQMRFRARVTAEQNAQDIIERGMNARANWAGGTHFMLNYNKSGKKLSDTLRNSVGDFFTDKTSSIARAFDRTQSNSNLLNMHEGLWSPGLMRKWYNENEAYTERWRRLQAKGEELATKEYALAQKYAGQVSRDYYRLEELVSNHRVSPFDPLGQGDNAHISTRPLDHNSSYEDWGAVGIKPTIDSLLAKTPQELQDLLREKLKQTKIINYEVNSKKLEGIMASYDPPAGSTLNEVYNRYLRGQQTKADEAHYEEIGAGTDINGTLAKLNQKGAFLSAFRQGDHVVNGEYKLPEGGNDKDLSGTSLPSNVRQFLTRKEAFEYTQKLGGLDFDATAKYYLPVIDAQGKITKDWFETSKDDVMQYGGKNYGPVERQQVTVENRRTEMRDSMSEALRIRDSMIAEGMDNVTGVLDKEKMQFSKLNMGNVDAALARLERRRDLTDLQKKIYSQVLRDTMLASQNARLPRTFMMRQNIAGAEWGPKAWQDYNNMASHYIAKMETLPKLNHYFKLMEDEFEAAGKMDPAKSHEMSSVLNELRKRMYSVDSTAMAPDIPKWIQHIQTVNFIDTLASPAHLMLHGIQPLMQVFPYLAARHGVSAAWREMGANYRKLAGDWPAYTGALQGAGKILGSPFVKDIGKRLEWKKGTNTIERFMNELPQGSPTRKAMEYLDSIGYFHKNAGLDLLDDARGMNMLTVNKAMRELTGVVDTGNRFLAAQSAFNLDFAKTKDFEHALYAAQETVEQALGHYSPTNVAPWLRNKWVRPFMQFKTHPMQLAYLLGRTTYNAFKFSDRKVQMQAVRQLTGLLGVAAVMSGINGLPTEILKVPAIISTLFGFQMPSMYSNDVQDTLTGWMGPKMAQVFMNGLPSLLGGFAPDIHHRAGYSSLFTHGEPDSTQWKDINKWMMDQMFATPFEYVQKVGQAMTDLRDGNYSKAAVNLVPIRLFDDIGKAYNLHEQGKPTLKGRPGLPPTGMGEAITTLLGFTPQTVSEYQAGQHVAHEEIQGRQDARSKIVMQIAQAKNFGDAAKLQEDWNRSHPDFRITGNEIRAERKREKAKEVFGIQENKTNRQTLEHLKSIYQPNYQ